MTERPLHCTIRNPVVLNITDTKSEFNSGCRIIDVSLSNIINPEPEQPQTRADIWKKFMLKYHLMILHSGYAAEKMSFDSAESCLHQNSHYDITCSHGILDVVVFPLQVGEIHFKNSYVAYLTVRAKCRVTDSKDGTEVKWRTCIKRMRLMPNPHVEAGAQDYFIITRKNMLFELVNVSALRLILQQPSPIWKEFKIEDLKVFRASESSKPSPLPAWLTDTADKSGKKKIEGIGNLETLSTNLQQLWAMSEEVAAQQTERSLGRYEVDGCYEINLLSYS